VRLLGHPVAALVAVAVGWCIALRAIFFEWSAWIWHFKDALPVSAFTPWARGAITTRDGIEPYVLLLMVVAHAVLTGASVAALKRAPPLVRALIVALLLVLAYRFAHIVPLRPPMREVDKRQTAVLTLVAASLLATWLVRQSTRRRTSIHPALWLLLVPLCFVPVGLPSLADLACILAPAARLEHGISPAEIYMQYDLLPSLLGVAWSKVGGAPLAFPLVTAACYYATLLGAFALARRLFDHAAADLAAALLTSMLLVRFYGIFIDANATPQVTPLRLELWLFLLAAAVRFGLSDWRVGLVLALLCFFSRSMGTLYVGAYGLTLAADLVARRRATAPAERGPLVADVRRAGRRAVPAALLVALAFICARVVFGDFGSDALATYRRLGVGMLPVKQDSFYWWLLPLTGAVGWLAFSRRGLRSEKRDQARIFAVALIFINSIYFFGRSHEHNLVNLGTSFLFLFVLGVDLVWSARDDDPALFCAIFRLAPWLLVAVCAYYYSARVIHKLDAQWELVGRQRPLPYALATDYSPVIDCVEIDRAAGDRRVYFFSQYDFWFYQRCGYLPEGYTQPLGLAILLDPYAEEVDHLLDRGYKVVVPRHPRDWSSMFPEVLSRLHATDVTETKNYRLYRRRPAPAM
jgi:hypothetical protein